MTAAPAIKGWCPTLLDPMPSGDGWLVRVKPTAATLTAAAARLLAGLAACHGNAHIDLTSRANLQVRGLTPRSAERLADEVIANGLAAGDPAHEAVRNVSASPLPDDPSAAFDSHDVARALEDMLATTPELKVLPSKFGFLVDGGGALPLRGAHADIMIRAVDGSLAVSLDRGHLAAACPTTVAETAGRLARAFLALSRGRNARLSRMRHLIDIVGEEAIFAAAGLTPKRLPQFAPAATPPPVGFTPYAGSLGAFGVGLPFGRIEADDLASLADLSERFGDGSLRTTPWRILLIAGVAAYNPERLADDVRRLRLIADPDDSRLHIHACVGAPGCASATVAARADAERLAVALGASPRGTLHVSGCAKSCAHRGPAAVTLIGRDGSYDLVRNGSASGRPSLTGLGIDDAVALLAAAGG